MLADLATTGGSGHVCVFVCTYVCVARRTDRFRFELLLFFFSLCRVNMSLANFSPGAFFFNFFSFFLINQPHKQIEPQWLITEL